MSLSVNLTAKVATNIIQTSLWWEEEKIKFNIHSLKTKTDGEGAPECHLPVTTWHSVISVQQTQWSV